MRTISGVETNSVALTNLTYLVAKLLGWTKMGSAATSFSPETWGRWLGTPPAEDRERERFAPSFHAAFSWPAGATKYRDVYVPEYARGASIDEVREWMAERGTTLQGEPSPEEVCQHAVAIGIASGLL